MVKNSSNLFIYYPDSLARVERRVSWLIYNLYIFIYMFALVMY